MRYVLLELVNQGWSSSNQVIDETTCTSLKEAVGYFRYCGKISRYGVKLNLDYNGYYKLNENISYCVAEVFGS